MLLQTWIQKIEPVGNPESTISRTLSNAPISYILGRGIHQILAPDLTHLPCEQDRALISCGREHGKRKVQFICEGHIRVRPNSQLVILGGCTLLNTEPFANKWCTRPIHLGNDSLFKTIELTKPHSKYSVPQQHGTGFASYISIHSRQGD